MPFISFDEPKVSGFVDFDAPEPPAEPRGILRAAGDTAVQFGKGAVSGVRMLADTFGADNAVSGKLRNATDALDGLLSASAQQDQRRVAEIMQEAEGKGWGDQIVSGLKAMGVAPGALLAQGLGTMAPTVAASLIPGVGPAAIASRFGSAGIGAAQGIGSVKGSIYETTKEKLKQAGATEAEAEARAVQAQEYGGDNSGQIALGGALGAVAGSTGAERAVSALRNGITKTPAGIIGRVAQTGVVEAVPEFLQGGQEKYAANTALANEGFDVDPMSGVVANATLEGLAGFGVGAGFGIKAPRVNEAQKPPAQSQPDSAPIKPTAVDILAAPDADSAIATFNASLTGTDMGGILGQANPLIAPAREMQAQAAADEADLADLAQTETRDLNTLRAQLDQESQKQSDLDALQSTGTGQYGVRLDERGAVEQAATVEAPTAMQLAMQRARERATPQPAATVVPVVEQDLAAAKQELAAAAPAPIQRQPDILPADISRNDGKPFQTENGAKLKQREAGGVEKSDIVPVAGGFVVRPKPTQETTLAQTTQAQPQSTQQQNGPDAVAPAVEGIAPGQPSTGQALEAVAQGTAPGALTNEQVSGIKSGLSAADPEDRESWAIILERKLEKKGSLAWSDVPQDLSSAMDTVAFGALKAALAQNPKAAIEAIRYKTPTPLPGAAPTGQANGVDPAASGVAVPTGAAEQVDAALSGGFDSAAFDKKRDDTIKASREVGNVHLDQVPAYVETMRGKRIYYAHDPKVQGTIRTVDNRGNVYVHWADDYSAKKEMASPVRDGKKEVMQSSLGPTDLKDYVVAGDAAKPADPRLIPVSKRLTSAEVEAKADELMPLLAQTGANAITREQVVALINEKGMDAADKSIQGLRESVKRNQEIAAVGEKAKKQRDERLIQLSKRQPAEPATPPVESAPQGEEVSRYNGKYGKGMGKDAARLEAMRLSRADPTVTYTAEEHNDPKLENPYAVVGRKVRKFEAKNGYQLPKDQGEWIGNRRHDFAPTPRQKIVMDSVQRALDEGLFYNSAVEAHVAKALGVSADTLAQNKSNVDGGDFGYDVYHARQALTARKGHETMNKVEQEMALKPGDKLGTLVFSDGKVTTGVEITGIKAEPARASTVYEFTGKRGVATAKGQTAAIGIKDAIDRAHEKGKRKDSYEKFIANRAPSAVVGRNAVEPKQAEAEPAPQSGEFGPILTQFKGDAQGAIKALTELQDGEAVAALNHPDVGDIDLVWGTAGTKESNGMGLAKLVKWHPEVLADLQGIISSLKVVDRNENRIQLESDLHKAAVRLEWDGKAKHWLLTAFEKKSAGGGTTTDTTANGVEGDTARLKSSETSVPQQPGLDNANQAATILDAANITGKDRLDILKDVKSGALTPDEVQAAFPAKPTGRFESIEIPDDTTRWMGFDGRKAVRADLEALAQRHPEYYDSAQQVRDDIEFVLGKPDGWYIHKDNKVILFRERGGTGAIPQTRIEVEADAETMSVRSVYVGSKRQITKKMAEKREVLGSLGLVGQSPDSLSIAEYLKALGDRSSRPTSPSGDASKAGVSVAEPAEPINTENAGEELTYNRRNRVKTGIKWADLADKEVTLRVSETTKANASPKPDYQALVDGGMQPIIAHIVKQAYDSLAATPNTGARTPTDADLKGYIEGVQRHMAGVMAWANNSDQTRAWIANMGRQAGTLSGAASGRPTDLITLSALAQPTSLFDTTYPNGWKGHEAELRLIGGNKALSGLRPSVDEAVKAMKDIGKGWPAKQEAWQKQGYSIVSGDEFAFETYVGKDHNKEPYVTVFVRLKKDGRSIDLMQRTFDGATSKDNPAAQEWGEGQIEALKGKQLLLGKYNRLQGAFDTLDAAKEKARELTKRDGKTTVSDKGISVEAAEREGVQHRMEGEDISSDRLKDVIGLRGVNFGNWLLGNANEAERQLHLNHAYDSFMDLAGLLGVPPKALSLNGMLGLAIGAQGKGGAAAHFYPGVNEINLTRTAGAGSLGHEFGHGLDHYFARLAGLDRQTDPFLTEHADRKVTGNIRPEIVDAFKAIVQAMNKRPTTEAETALKRQESLKKAERNVTGWLASIRTDFERLTVNGVTRNNAKQDAPADLMEKFDAMAARIKVLDLGDGKSMAGDLAMSQPVSDMRDLYKAATGRVYSLDQLRGLQSNVDHLKYLTDAKASTADHVPQMVGTDYAAAALNLDKNKGGKRYWSTNLEKFARAFDAFISDKLEAAAAKNTYLSHAGRTGETVPMGSERTVINAAFQKLVNTIQTREDDAGNVAMFARGPEQESAELNALKALSENDDLFLQRVRAIVASSKIKADVQVVATPAELAAKTSIEVPSDARGLYHNGTIYVVASNNRTAADVHRTIAHEAIGHHGLREMLGEDWTKMMAQINLGIKTGNKALKSISEFVRRTYVDADGNFNLTPQEEADEIAAYAVEQGVDPETGEFRPGFGFLKSMFAQVARFLRDMGIPVQFTNMELQGMLVSAQRNLQRGTQRDGMDVAMAARKGDQTDSPEFKKWFSPSPRDVLAGSGQAVINSLKAHTKGLADFLESAAVKAHRNGSIEIPSSVFSHMAGAVSDPKVLDVVVRSLPVDVVDFFRRKKFSPQDALHDSAVLKDVFSFDPTSNVALGIDPSSIALLSMRLVANAGAKITGLTGGAFERNAAVLADANDPVLGAHVRKSSGGDLSILHGFGGSKVVNPDGSPMVVYHGTGADFNAFDPDATPNTWEKDRGLQFFTNNASDASAYAEELGGGANVMPVHLSMQNPRVEAADGDPSVWWDEQSPYKWDMDVAGMGHDGLIVNGDGGRSLYVASKPGQIKSATGNNGDFSATNPDIRFARSAVTGQPLAQTWQGPDESRMDNMLYSMQDKLIDTKRVVTAVRDAIGGIADNLDPYLQEELYHGRAAKSTKDFLEQSIRPLMVDMQARGVEMSDFEEYLHNRHAERRNVQVAKVNPNMQDGGSGIKTADARAYLAGLPAAKRAAYQALAKRVDQMTKETRALLVSSGLEKQSTINAWDAAYGDEYVPLMREEMDNGAMGIGQGFSVRGSSSKRAMGSDKPVANILANIALQREKAITRAEKRKIGEALYGMVLSAPNPDFWFAVDPALQQSPAQITATSMQLISMGMNPVDAQQIAEEPTQRYIDPRTGQVASRINPALRSAENVLAVRMDGEDKYVFFNARDPRAMRMAKALKNLDADQLGMVMGNVAKVTRYFAAVNTSFSPIFGVVNLTRDIQAALLNLQSTRLAGKQADVMKHVGSALRGIYIDLRDHRAGKNPTSTWASLFEEFQREGGATGFRDMYANAQERADAIADELKKIKQGKAMEIGRGVFGWLQDYNDSMENAVRLAAYKVAKEQGMSNQQAASLAKNLTVNFNRKGQVALQAGALFAFFNAAVQGSARLSQTMFEPGKVGKLSGLGKKIMTGGLLLGSMQALLLAAAGFDDEEPPDFVRERALVLPIGRDKYVSIPMPLGFHVIPSLARIPTEWAMGGFKDTPKRIGQLVSLFADAFNPIGSAGLSLQTLAPTIIDPLAALAENRDWTGKPIAKKDFNSMQPTAGHLRAKDTATPWARAISYGVNWVTGGTDYKPGLASPTPDQIDYLIGQATGGIGREVSKLSQVATSTVSGEELPLYKIPLLGRFVGTTAGQAAESGRFYANLKEIGEHDSEITGLKKDRRMAEYQEYVRDNPQARLVPIAERTYREVSKLNRAKRDALKAGASKERIKLIDQQITARMAAFNLRVRATEIRETATQE